MPNRLRRDGFPSSPGGGPVRFDDTNPSQIQDHSDADSPRPHSLPVTPPPQVRHYPPRLDRDYKKRYIPDGSVSPTPRGGIAQILGGPLEESHLPAPLDRPLFAYGQPVEDDIKTLLDLTWMELPPVPNLYDPNAMKSTRKLSSYDIKLAPESRLSKIIYVPDLVDQFAEHVADLLRSISVDLENPIHRDFANHVIPWHTARGLPEVIFSEKDSEDYVTTVLLRPALAVVHAVARQGIRAGHDDQYPFVSSAAATRGAGGQRDVIPDVTLIISEDTHSRSYNIGMTIEVKSHGALPEEGNPLSRLQRKFPEAARAIKFNWPTKVYASSKDENMIMQIWSQCINRHTQYSILSSLDVTVFAYRKNDTFYISESYNAVDVTLFSTVSWMLLATLLVEMPEIVVPDPQKASEWWEDESIANETRFGVCNSSVPPIGGESRRRRARLPEDDSDTDFSGSDSPPPVFRL